MRAGLTTKASSSIRRAAAIHASHAARARSHARGGGGARGCACGASGGSLPPALWHRHQQEPQRDSREYGPRIRDGTSGRAIARSDRLRCSGEPPSSNMPSSRIVSCAPTIPRSCASKCSSRTAGGRRGSEPGRSASNRIREPGSYGYLTKPKSPLRPIKAAAHPLARRRCTICVA